jgi:DNA-binding XRE family transcriptional regulator
LAATAGIDEGTIIDFELGRRRPSTRVMALIMTLLDEE